MWQPIAVKMEREARVEHEKGTKRRKERGERGRKRRKDLAYGCRRERETWERSHGLPSEQKLEERREEPICKVETTCSLWVGSRDWQRTGCRCQRSDRLFFGSGKLGPPHSCITAAVRVCGLRKSLLDSERNFVRT